MHRNVSIIIVIFRSSFIVVFIVYRVLLNIILNSLKLCFYSLSRKNNTDLKTNKYLSKLVIWSITLKYIKKAFRSIFL